MSDNTHNPLVSILIPTFNRPRYLELALNSALKQTYENIEIIVCDDSSNDETEKMIMQYLQKYSKLKYIRNLPPNDALKNFDKCLSLSNGELINYLMDDDLFHTDKVKTMVECFLDQGDISLVTSYRKLINEDDKPLEPIPATKQLSEVTSIYDGRSLSNYVLLNMLNVIGEPTTVMFRRKDMDVSFGEYYGERYYFNVDVAAWLYLLSKGNAVYLPQPLSSFRLHKEQNQNQLVSSVAGHLEWFKLIMDSCEHGHIGYDPLENWINRSLPVIKQLKDTKATSEHKQKLYECLRYATKSLLKL